MQRSLLTKELDEALDLYEHPGQKKHIEPQPKRKGFWVSLFGGSEQSVQKPAVNPQTFLGENASLALIEAAANNKFEYVKRLLKVRFVSPGSQTELIPQNKYFEAVYFALVAAAQSGHTEVFNFLINECYRTTPNILAAVIERSNVSWAIGTRFQSIDFASKAARSTTYSSIHERLGLEDLPNVWIEAAKYGRLEIIKILLLLKPLGDLQDKCGYYPCMKAAEEGHVAIMEEFLKHKNVSEKIFNNGDVLRLAAMAGQLASVEKLMELHKYGLGTLLAVLEDALQHGTAEVVERLLKEKELDEYLKYDGDDLARIELRRKCGYNACYLNTSKPSLETAARMFEMLLKYPVIAQLAEESKHASNDENVVYAVLKKLKMVPDKSVESAKVSLTKSGGLFDSIAVKTATEQQSMSEFSYRF